MKKALLYLLLFSYITIICKPVLPSLSDGIAHIFWYTDHMATVHYEHGKYHVHNEYKDAAKKGYPEKDASLPKSDNPISYHLITPDSYDFSFKSMAPRYLSAIPAMLPHTFLNSDFLPPRA
ncbi:MAG: hypothetical protein ABIQ88_00445 [Chitinophagaceae bacterium]